jgi:membrane protease YdiL (CAAX protease family)
MMHLAPLAVAYASLAGLVLGVVRMRTGSVLPAIALHGAFNATPVLLPETLVRIEGFNTVGERVYHLPLPLLLGSACVATLCLVTMSRSPE